MRLEFTHHGKKFFFITFVLEGRPQILSQLTDEHHRPTLSDWGEIVKSAFLAVHQVFPAVTLSDFVIMPDHVHYLMIVDYEKSPEFNPLWANHRLIDAIEEAWKQRGPSAPEPPNLVALLKAAVDRGRENAARLAQALAPLPPFGPARGSGSSLPDCSIPRFDRHCYIELAFTAPQIKTIRRYIKLNPARALWKAHHPDRFLRFANVLHPVLDPSRIWQGMGNLTLLASPFLFHVRLTLKKSVAEHEDAIAEIVDRAKRGEIPVSGFISPGEVEALKRLKATPEARFVKILPCALPPRYDPSAEDSRELAADRLLILSGFADTPPISGRDIRRAMGASRQFRANCLAMNDLAAALCERAKMLV